MHPSLVKCERDHHPLVHPKLQLGRRFSSRSVGPVEGVEREYYLTLDMKCHSCGDLIPKTTLESNTLF